MTNEYDKQLILDFYTESYEQSPYYNLCPCNKLSTGDCKMLRLYIADNPENYAFGNMYGIFEYEDDLYKFTWHIHEPKQKFASLSNRMTNIERLIVRHKAGYEFVSETIIDSGHKAFWINTPDDYLDGFDLSLRKLMKNIKAYAVANQFCKHIKTFDSKHLEWLENIMHSENKTFNEDKCNHTTDMETFDENFDLTE